MLATHRGGGAYVMNHTLPLTRPARPREPRPGRESMRQEVGKSRHGPFVFHKVMLCNTVNPQFTGRERP
jgi:hypothetical protein